MTIWTITCKTPDDDFSSAKVEGTLLYAILHARRMAKKLRNGLNPIVNVCIEANRSQVSFTPVFTFLQDRRVRLSVLDISVNGKFVYRIGRSVKLAMRLGYTPSQFRSSPKTHFLVFEHHVADFTSSEMRRIRTRLQKNVISPSVSNAGVLYDIITPYVFLAMLSMPFTIAPTGIRLNRKVDPDMPTGFEDPRAGNKILGAMVNLCIENPRFLDQMVDAPPTRFIEPTVEVIKWVSDNGIKWISTPDGFELTSDEDYTLYKVAFE